jgi:hypothetical protein
VRSSRTKFVSQGVNSYNAPKKGDDIELAASKAERLYLGKTKLPGSASYPKRNYPRNTISEGDQEDFLAEIAGHYEQTPKERLPRVTSYQLEWGVLL